MPKIHKGQHLSELRFRAIFIRDDRRKFRSILAVSLVALLIVVVGKQWIGSWEVGFAGGALYIAVVTLWVMCES